MVICSCLCVVTVLTEQGKSWSNVVIAMCNAKLLVVFKTKQIQRLILDKDELDGTMHIFVIIHPDVLYKYIRVLPNPCTLDHPLL